MRKAAFTRLFFVARRSTGTIINSGALPMCSKKKRIYTIWIGVVGLVLVAGCVSKQAVEIGPAAAPTVGSGLHYRGGERVFIGIGLAGQIKSRSLLRATADNAARETLAEVLHAYVQNLAAAAAQVPDDYVYALTQNALSKAVISNHWHDGAQQGSRLRAQCTLSLSDFKNTLAAFRALNAADREAMLARAEDQFDAMARAAQ